MDSESIYDFVTRCRLRKMPFRDNLELEERIIQRIIAGTRFPELQQQVLTNIQLSWKQAIELGRTYNSSISYIKQIKVVQDGNATEVHDRLIRRVPGNVQIVN